MARDPHQIFREAHDGKRETLRVLWPELYDALKPPDDARKALCAAAVHDYPIPPAVGRMSLNGHPACVACLARCPRPGGYPLKLIDRREWHE